MKFPKCLLLLTFACAGTIFSLSCGARSLDNESVETEDVLVAEVKDEEEDPLTWFTISEIDDELFARIKGKSYKDDCTVPLADLRYLTVAHYVAEGGGITKGEIICNKEIAEDLMDIFLNLYNIGYPIESLRLIDDYDADDVRSMQDNNSSCFNFRKIAGSKKLSKHAMGLAIDINPLYNPYVKVGNEAATVSPAEGKPYIDRKGDFPYKIDKNDPCYKEFVKHGFTWGGAWQTVKDYQHFEK